MANNLPPIPQDNIGENFKWRDWFRTLRSLVQASSNYGCFISNADQTFAAANTPYKLSLPIQTSANGMSLSDSKITVDQAGTYNIQYSLQVANTATSIHEIYIWFRKNGADVDASNSKFSVTAKHGSVDGYLITISNLVVEAAANDYFEVYASVSNTAIYLEKYAASTSPAMPSIPSSIVTVTQLS